MASPDLDALRALADGQLAPADEAEWLERLRGDAALRDEFARIALAKRALRHAYADATPPLSTAPPDDASASARTVGMRRGPVVAAGLALLACGLGLGWAARERTGAETSATATTPLRALTALPAAASTTLPGDTSHVMVHLSSGAPRDAVAALDRAEGILEAAAAAGRPVWVEIVANGGGLDLLREGVSAHAARIARLRTRYPTLTFVACGQTAQRLRDDGVEVHLLPGITTASSALDEIVQRLQQGWIYLRT